MFDMPLRRRLHMSSHPLERHFPALRGGFEGDCHTREQSAQKCRHGVWTAIRAPITCWFVQYPFVIAATHMDGVAVAVGYRANFSFAQLFLGARRWVLGAGLGTRNSELCTVVSFQSLL